MFNLRLVILIAAWIVSMAGCAQKESGHVVVYAAQDQVYAEPVLAEFTRQTGIKIRALYDSEAVKTVGLANRLLAERSHPQCDVFWGNEELRTRQLAAAGVFRRTNGWAAFGYRSRRIVINTNLVPRAEAPTHLTDLTNAIWRSKVALGYPLFGTTATHFLALREHWGEAHWLAWCRSLQANQPLLVDGNSVVVQMVGRGEAWIGLTDSDDIAAGQRNGLPIEALPLTQESLLIPNTVGIVAEAPNAIGAQILFEYLQQPNVAKALVSAEALEGFSEAHPETPHFVPDWSRLLENLKADTQTLKAIFLR